MALIITGKKGWAAVTNMYLMLAAVSVQKRMTMEVGNNVPMIVATVQAYIYPNKEARMMDFNGPAIVESFTFIPTGEGYPTDEAYAHIKTNGLPGWTLTNKVDDLE